jgi:isopenicillin N synthase-like dioxygenase
MDPGNKFDPFEKERVLQAESQTWDTSQVDQASPQDIPVIDVSEYFHTGCEAALETTAIELGEANRKAGFFFLSGHGIPQKSIADALEQASRFHKLPIKTKLKLQMDQPAFPIQGVGYLPFKNKKLPHRPRGNLNEAFLLKRDHEIALADNLWPGDDDLPGFRKSIEQYANRLEELALRLLPIYARALNLEKTFFEPAFTEPFYRLRLTHFPDYSRDSSAQYGIAPHVDTTFFTLLVQDSPGLCIFSEKRQCWISVPMNQDAIIVNTGELLKHWTNDEFVSVKHFANNNLSGASRYSIPFFFNANTNFRMTCVPSCCGPGRPAKYPAISYTQSQGVAQGE